MTEEETRSEKLKLFAESIGKKFVYTYAPPNGPLLIDEVTGVDMQYQHVCGKKFGNPHIDYVELVKD